MRRPWRSIPLILGAFLVLGALSPAGAKGVGYHHGELEGPGLERPIIVPNRNPYLLNGELFEMVAGHTSASTVPSSTALGPRYSLRYHLFDGRRVLVHFYPYAEPRPVGFVPPGQYAGVPTEHGPERVLLDSTWYEYPRRLVEVLQERGLPLPTDQSSSVSMSLLLTTVLVALGALLLTRVSGRGQAQPNTA